ncbi:hypothetical protein H9P43_009449 [Blastocladiella emersonii ATCC 22665]|nr:hypothetical protein H9P43_009449 [Blastocladiella emersonii ATCC 22665]
MISSFTNDKIASNLSWPMPAHDPIGSQPGAESAYESTSHSSYVTHDEPGRYDAFNEYHANKNKAHQPAEWASNGEKVSYTSSYKSTFAGTQVGAPGAGPAKIPPIPRTCLGRSSSRHEATVAEHRAYTQAPLANPYPYPAEIMSAVSLHRAAPLDGIPQTPEYAKREISATASTTDQHVPYNILNGTAMPGYARARMPGTFFAGRVSAAKLEAKANARSVGYNILTHETHVPEHPGKWAALK